MIRGTNPTHIFSIPFDTRMVEEVLIVYMQNNVEVLRKETDDCVFEDNMIGVTLTQDETLEFNQNANVHIQIRVLTTEDVSYVSPVLVYSVKKCLSNEVI